MTTFTDSRGVQFNEEQVRSILTSLGFNGDSVVESFKNGNMLSWQHGNFTFKMVEDPEDWEIENEMERQRVRNGGPMFD